MKIKRKPVAMLKHYIACRLHFEKKGQKLLDVAFALFGITVGVSILQMVTLVVCRLPAHLFWRTLLPWFPIFCWASWRFFLRYLSSKAFVCHHCGRLKCFKARSEENFGEKKICRECEKRNKGVQQSIDAAKRKADLLLQEVQFLAKHSGEPPAKT